MKRGSVRKRLKEVIDNADAPQSRAAMATITTELRRASLRRLRGSLTWQYALVIFVPVALTTYAAQYLDMSHTVGETFISHPVSIGALVAMCCLAFLGLRPAATKTQTALEELEESRSTVDNAVELQQLLVTVANKISDVSMGSIADDVHSTLETIGKCLPKSHLVLITFSRVTGEVTQWIDWHNDRTTSLPRLSEHAVRGLDWMWGKVEANEKVAFRSLDELPEEATNEKSVFEMLEVKSGLLAPLSHGGCGDGFLGFVSRAKGRTWNETELDLLAGLLSAVIERTDTEEALRESQARFHGIIHAASDAIVSMDTAQNILIFNNGAETMFGYKAHEVIGRPVEMLFPSDHATAFRTYVQNFLDSDVSARVLGKHGEINGLRDTGEEFPVDATISKLEDGNESTLLTLIMRDITERKRSESEKEKLEGQLRQASKMEAIGGLAGGIAHDFNNLLGSMIGNAELALDRVGQDDKLNQNIQRVLKAGHRASGLVKQILTFSRMEDSSGRPIEMYKVVDEALALVTASLPAMIEIRTDMSRAVGRVLGDESEVHQIIMNLCTNAYHAIGDDGGLITVGLQTVDVDEALITDQPALRRATYVKLSVSDTGCGMDAATAERIFEPFFTTKPVGKGTGMGLSVIHGIIVNRGGATMVNTAPGEGTTIDVYLPRFEGIAQPDKEECGEAEEIEKEGSERILLVDDEEQLVVTTQEILEHLGYQVTACSDSLRALKEFEANPDRFDVVITDQAMPNLCGVDLAQAMMKIRPDLPVIIATGFSEKVTPETAQELGLRGYISKPFMKSDLSRALREVFGESESAEA